ncbi:MAG: segregation/condensation protein A [Planctomycetota bacterium]
MSFRVALDIFHGPLDLLLHLVRKDELEIAALPVATVTQQYLEYAAVLEELDVDSIGDFLEVASMLVEIKSRYVLPRVEEEEPADAVDDPGEDLVQRLLEFKAYRDAAGRLEQQGAEWRQQFARQSPDVPARSGASAEQPLVQVELWDLVCAFGRVMQEKLEPPTVQTIPYDETPVHVFMQRIHTRLQTDGETQFSELFPARSVHKSTLIVMFLAILELVRHRHALAEQSERYGDLLLCVGTEPLAEDTARVVSADGGV